MGSVFLISIIKLSSNTFKISMAAIMVAELGGVKLGKQNK